MQNTSLVRPAVAQLLLSALLLLRFRSAAVVIVGHHSVENTSHLVKAVPLEGSSVDAICNCSARPFQPLHFAPAGLVGNEEPWDVETIGTRNRMCCPPGTWI